MTTNGIDEKIARLQENVKEEQERSRALDVRLIALEQKGIWNWVGIIGGIITGIGVFATIATLGTNAILTTMDLRLQEVETQFREAAGIRNAAINELYRYISILWKACFGEYLPSRGG